MVPSLLTGPRVPAHECVMGGEACIVTFPNGLYDGYIKLWSILHYFVLDIVVHWHTTFDHTQLLAEQQIV